MSDLRFQAERFRAIRDPRGWRGLRVWGSLIYWFDTPAGVWRIAPQYIQRSYGHLILP